MGINSTISPATDERTKTRCMPEMRMQEGERRERERREEEREMEEGRRTDRPKNQLCPDLPPPPEVPTQPTSVCVWYYLQTHARTTAAVCVAGSVAAAARLELNIACFCATHTHR